jgi:hypothetical protein
VAGESSSAISTTGFVTWQFLWVGTRAHRHHVQQGDGTCNFTEV